MSHNNSTINLDDSSVLSSTKNSSALEVTDSSASVIEILSSSSETEGEDEDAGNSISENVDSESERVLERSDTIDSLVSGDETNENYITTTGTASVAEVEDKTDINLNVETSADQSSVLTATQLLSHTDCSALATNGDTTGEGRSLVAELEAGLANHKMKLSEVVVEAVGEVTEEEEKLNEAEDSVNVIDELSNEMSSKLKLNESTNVNENVTEIIEETFKDKVLAKSFGEVIAEKEEESVPIGEEFDLTSPHKRKVGGVAGELSSGEVTDVEDNLAGVGETAGLPAKRPKVSPPDLPSTCTVLTSPVSGATVYLVGTAHFSRESCEDVSCVIRAVQPDIVMVELCKARSNILHLDEQTIQEEAQNLDLEKTLEIIRSQGAVQGVMYLLLLSMSAHLTKELGMAPGGEFRRAFMEAKAVPGCLVHLGDRPINITLKRAISALSAWQKVKLGWNILTSKESITKEEVEKCKDKDLLQNMLAEMAGEFPALSTVFVEERDIFLAHSLQMAADTVPSGGSSRTVVGVVGIGHQAGIAQHWGRVSREQVQAVVKVDPPSLLSRAVRLTLRSAFWGGCLYGVYRVCRGPASRLLLAR